MQRSIGRYQILEEIASGAQGTVYRAFDPEGGQIIALKVLHPTLSGDRTYIERFRREASLAASINHPNVVKIFEVGQDGDRHFMALEFLPESLAGVIESVGQLRIEGAVRFGVQIADGLAAAHALGIVHRDIKLQNVLIGPDGTAKVTDFGIARAESLATMTATGVVMGTPHYMSPEQSRGERADARSDVYSLGCMVYQMLAGQVPFKGDTPLAVIRQQIDEQPPRLREVRRDLPRRLEQVVERSMAKEPSRRYQRVAEMAQALRAAVPGLAEPARAASPRPQPAPPPPQPRPAAPPEPTPRPPSRTWMSAWAGAWQRSHRRRWAWIGTLLSITVALTVAGVRLGVYDQARDYVEEAGWFGAAPERPAPPTQPESAAALVPAPTSIPVAVLLPTQTPGPAQAARPTPTPFPAPTPVRAAQIAVATAAPAPAPTAVATATPAPQPTATAAPATAPTTAGPRYGGTLRLALSSDPFSNGFSPYASVSTAKVQVNSLIFSGLFRKDYDSSEFTGDLAESWEVSADGRTWTIRLREDARFHDGRPVTGEDVIWSLKAMLAPSSRVFEGLAETVSDLYVVDDLTVVIETSEPFAPFLDVLAGAGARIVPTSLIGAGDVGRADLLVGSGPFRLVDYAPGQAIILERNREYFRQPLPYVDRVEFLLVSERTSRLAAFLTGRVDFAGPATGSGLDPSELEQIRLSENAVLFKSWAVAPALRFDTQNPPFDNLTVRRAVALAIDRQLWDDGVNNGQGMSEFPVPSLYFPEWAQPESVAERVLTYDPARAKQFLAEAGYGDGLQTVIYVWAERYMREAEFIAEMLSRVGMQVEVRREDRAVVTERLLGEEGYKGMFYGGTTGVTLGIDGFLAANFLPGGFANYSRLRDREIESLFRAQREALDQNKRRALVAELEKYIFEAQTYLVPMPSVRQIQAHGARIQGFRFQPDMDLGTMLERVWIGEATPSPTTAVVVASPTPVPVPTATAVSATRPVPVAATSPQQWRLPPVLTIDSGKRYTATIELEKGGAIEIELFADKAPITVNNFVFLARQGYYDGVTFHRVIPDFMAQSGDPTGTGSGGPGYRFDNEFHPDLRHSSAGILSMANRGLQNGTGTNGSQFFITFVPTLSLDGLNPDGSPKDCSRESCHSVFGRVIAGMDVVEGITERNPSTATTPGDAIRTIRIAEWSEAAPSPATGSASTPPVPPLRATSPVSGRIAFMSNRDGNWEIYVMNTDGSGETRLTNNLGDDRWPTWSPDGVKIAFGSEHDGSGEIYVMNADGSGQTNLTNNPAFDSDPAWSPDGAKIAFASVRDGNWEIHVMNADGSDQTNLTNNTASDSDPAWSPDGAKIAFSSERDGSGEIYVMNADGSGQTNLTNNPDFDSDPAWSPDGAKIAFASVRDGNWEIHVMNADGSGETRITNNGATDIFPAWSPDGARIAFHSYRDFKYEIYMMNADGSGQTRLTNNDGDDLTPAWSPK